MAGKDNTKRAAAETPAYTVHESVIISLARKAVAGIPGFIRFSGSSIVSDLADLVRSKRMQDRSIQIEHKGNAVVVTIAVNPYYGFKFPPLIDEIQRKVSETVLEMTGVKVASVNVDIRGIEDLPAKDEAAGNGENEPE